MDEFLNGLPLLLERFGKVWHFTGKVGQRFSDGAQTAEYAAGIDEEFRAWYCPAEQSLTEE